MKRFAMSFDLRSIIVAPGEGQVVRVPGHPYTYKAKSADTGGAYALIEVTITGDGPPQHIHGAEEEAFYVIEGSVNIQVGDDVVLATPGAFVLIPRGTVHTFWNASATPARLLVIVSPPGLEQYLAEVIGDAQIDTPTYIDKVTAMAHKYQMTIVGPPRG
jgi:mannose-6-phosphate isomerase-like protein (cupin superfamily)